MKKSQKTTVRADSSKDKLALTRITVRQLVVRSSVRAGDQTEPTICKIINC
jgi:hypothetical protein